MIEKSELDYLEDIIFGVGAIVHGMIVNGVQIGFCGCSEPSRRDIELAANEKVDLFEYKKINSGFFRGNICFVRIKTNFGNYHPSTGHYGTNCWTTDVTDRLYELPDDSTFLNFITSIANPGNGYLVLP